MRRVLIAISLLLLMAETNLGFWSRRRRRRRSPPSPPPCRAVNCQMGSWTSWGPCTHQCGTSGEQIRKRQKIQAASCGGTCHDGRMSESQACNEGNCQNGGTPRNGGCNCRAGYRGTCCDQGESKR